LTNNPDQPIQWTTHFSAKAVTMKKLSKYTVESIEIGTGRLIIANVEAISAADALRFERAHFGEPFFRVLRAYPKRTLTNPAAE
jgi:hypothetical protein